MNTLLLLYACGRILQYQRVRYTPLPATAAIIECPSIADRLVIIRCNYNEYSTLRSATTQEYSVSYYSRDLHSAPFDDLELGSSLT